MYSVALVLAFLAAEDKNRQLEDLTQAEFCCVPERFLLSVRTKSIPEKFCKLIITPIVVLELWRPRTLRFYSGIVDPFIFIHQLCRFFL